MVKEAKLAQARASLPALPHTKFRSPSDRDRHARAVHEKWRDYKCPNCSSLFAGKSDMVRHCRVVHERRRDHKCPHCSSRFGRAANMRQHCKTVHEKVRAHACIYCDGVAFGAMSSTSRRCTRSGATTRAATAPALPSGRTAI